MFVAELHVCITTSGSCSDSNPLLTTLLPALVGVALGFVGSLFLQRRERDWQRRRDGFAREMQVVKPLDDALVETQLRVAGYGVDEGQSRYLAAREKWESGWVRLTPHLTDDELEARYASVGTILLELWEREDDDDFRRGAAMRVAQRAIGNARLALAYWLRGDPLPPSSFPSSQETIELLGQGNAHSLAPDAPLRQWLDEHPQPPWRGSASPRRRRWRRRGEPHYG